MFNTQRDAMLKLGKVYRMPEGLYGNPSLVESALLLEKAWNSGGFVGCRVLLACGKVIDLVVHDDPDCTNPGCLHAFHLTPMRKAIDPEEPLHDSPTRDMLSP